MNSSNNKKAPDHKADARKELEESVAAYRESVGSAAEDCIVLLQSLIGDNLLKRSSSDLLVELLEILEGLSADPITVSCAMLHVAAETRIASEGSDHPGPLRGESKILGLC